MPTSIKPNKFGYLMLHESEEIDPLFNRPIYRFSSRVVKRNANTPYWQTFYYAHCKEYGKLNLPRTTESTRCVDLDTALRTAHTWIEKQVQEYWRLVARDNAAWLRRIEENE